ncbi:hypothetical protein Q0590_08760 [Rhodocytophaga aerolata]|uniref:Uncharacterized protein n=1 Tax=Rhodocytophaga aerolata TaxID=455078 RepID=A0ABT8R2K9_9BACT|nr:hypothetical protein [Rhodocytophaga aerolata]MDO1446339.1 hypothetical protein [Rhodocytophaga aerolata]
MGLDLSHVVPTLKTSETEILDYFTLEELSIYPEYLQQYKHLLMEKEYDDFGKHQVIYLKEIGYQRKGMKRKFYEDFQNDKLYLDLSSVKKAYQYLEGDHITPLKELQRSFQQNFIDNFIEGKSIFWANW